MNARRFGHPIERRRAVFSGLTDRRAGDNRRCSMADIALSAFAVFFTQCPSFLGFQQNMEKAHGRNNARSLFGIERIPCGNHIRQALDPVKASELFGLLDDLHQTFDKTGLLEAMRAVKNTRLIALDATWHFSSRSQNIHCENCSCLRPADGQTARFHGAITPVIVSPGFPRVAPLCPEFIRPQDGQVKQDCEINAARRWVAANAAGRARWKIENENNNVLKTKGYHLEHNFGHGKQHLSSVLPTLNLLAFALHTLLDVTGTGYRLVRAAVGARRKFFQHLEALTACWFFENWERRMDFIMRGQGAGPCAAQKSQDRHCRRQTRHPRVRSRIARMRSSRAKSGPSRPEPRFLPPRHSRIRLEHAGKKENCWPA